MDTTGWVNADGRATRRIWKAVDGTYVPEGDQRAAFLAYGEGARISPVDLGPLSAQVAPTALVEAGGPPAKLLKAPVPDKRTR